VEVLIMLALSPRVVDAVWAAVEPLLPSRPPDRHPLGCHRPRISDRVCFEAILFRLVTGCSWDVAGRLGKGGETTLRNRCNDWIAAGVFDALVEEALCGYDRIIGLDFSECAVDGSQHKAPSGGEGTGPNPTDRGKTGWKWSLATDRHGIPIGWATDGANRNDVMLAAPTLDAVAARGLLVEIETMHLDRGYDNTRVVAACTERDLTDVVCAKRRAPGHGRTKLAVPLGLRWPIERTNSWLSNYGQLRRNTDRRIAQRLAHLALAVTLIITVKLVKWATRWND
jgi:transposase